MVKHVDDAGALFGQFWSGVADYQELNRASQADAAVDRWSLIKAMPIGKRPLSEPLMQRQQRAWIEQPVPTKVSETLVSHPVMGRGSVQTPALNETASQEALSSVFGRLQGGRRSLLKRLLRRFRHSMNRAS